MLSRFPVRKLSLAVIACSAAMVMATPLPAFADAGFQRWISQFRSVAMQNGISGSTYDRAFRGVSEPDPEVLEKARYQPEFRAEAWEYFDNRVQQDTIETGRRMARQWKPWLDRIERQFGVSRYVLLAIWSIESNYGEVLKNERVMRSLPRSLATLAYADKRRAKFARQQLIAALKILQTGDIDVGHLTSSWAGAMGHTQFIPTSYQAYAVDMDGDGRRDIWSSVPDALATAANLLRKNGWRGGETWGYETAALPSGRKFPGGKMALSRWQSIGVVRANGKPFPRPSDTAELKVPDGRAGPIFLVTKNFDVIKRYNNSDKYALAVGLLADEIAGYGGLVRDWDRPFERLSYSETEELQKRLGALGYYDGPIDGKIGSGSRDAIRAFQARSGMQQDGHPGKEVLRRLRSN
ncbi:lytic murein transglycosylase [Nitratireductor indicus]|uniref:Lytic murein transglycosylase n=2 Tax=Phyllobacteriaceae TaxID=69277 RepID=K2P4V0_9HYPH|nr:lytic murein transglycosylase [Nitratireductor indicus]EKF42396.1 lytic murein transglycosylase [Nitratireductor indicus C115]MDS1137903.1 lytic murein transglycosylase [Nitratireductor indicus]SFQ55593.1 membrane-bound lytic murein transglycosylase B [Nitratireductor indicus]